MHEYARVAGRKARIVFEMRRTLRHWGALRETDISRVPVTGQSDALKYLLADNCPVAVRLSGTEPKLKGAIPEKDRTLAF